MKTISKLFFLTCTLCAFIACGTSKSNSEASTKAKLQVVSVAFYNIENFFDTIDGPNIDEEFLPNGAMKWTSYKYKAKLKNMSYAISQLGLDITPGGASIIGLSELENRSILEDIVKQPVLANRQYKIAHFDSPDRRGVDVGLLYNPRDFQLSSKKSFRLRLPSDTAFRTRDQLLVSGYLLGEKVHVIVNHWPSRTGGEVASEPKRIAAAALTKSIVDSLYLADANSKIIIMGDLNDDPSNLSTSQTLGAKRSMDEVQEKGLYNPMWRILEGGVGSLSYNSQWNLFDQIIISKPLIQNNNEHLRFWKAEVFNKNFLIQQEGTYKGSPKRTHAGGVWLDGFSDHFPTLIYLTKEKK